MSQKRPQAKFKLHRRMGENVTGDPRSPVNVRSYKPGQHGPKGSKKPTVFGLQLMAKQKLKGYYANISEKKFRKYYAEAVRRRGDTSEILIELLERRLDAVVYRLKFAPTMFAARQVVNHGHILVNGKRVNIPSYVVQDNDVISVRPSSKEIQPVLAGLNRTEREVPEYLEVDHSKLEGKFLRGPAGIDDVPYPVIMEPNLVIEYYSR